ncbi:MAG: Spy/CpxP family protein refolding chaperone [bacterium]
MKQLKVVTCVLLCLASTAWAQGRGGRLGGPGDGPVPSGPLCHNRGDAAVKTTDQLVNVNGVDVPTQVVVLTGKPGAMQLLYPCPVGLGGADPFAKAFFPPELIMGHQQAIGLTDAQRASVRTLMLDAQKSFVPVQFKVAGEVETLQGLINASPVDEKSVLDEVDRILALEREVKREQLILMIRLKNLLTQQQQEALAKFRD